MRLIIIWMICCLLGCQSPTISRGSCAGINPDLQIDAHPELADIWGEAQSVFAIPYSSYLSARPNLCDALKLEEINCAAQAVLLENAIKKVLVSDSIRIAVWTSPDVSWSHANVIVSLASGEYVIDRNYGPKYPMLPMTLDEWKAYYGDRIYEKY